TASGLGLGYSTVSVAGGTIYTAGSAEGKDFVIALNLDGKPKWKVPNGAAWTAKNARWARGYDGSRATPTVDDGIVYHLGASGRLVALSAKDGKEKWAIDIASMSGATIPKYGYTESLLIDGNNLICYPGGPKGYMVALDKKTGKTVWANTSIGEAAAFCSPILVETGGVRQIVTMTRKAVIGVDAKTGALLWRQEHTNKHGNNIASPVHSEGFLYAGTGYGGGSVGIKLTALSKTVKATKAWFSRSLDNHHGGVVLVDGYVYGTGHQKAGWTCLDLKTGEEKYRTQGVGKGSAVYADGMLYCLSESGTMGLVPATPKEHKVVSGFKAPRGGKGLHWAHPVVCDGRLYIRHADKLFVYDIKAK
ncbi:MAG: PQQ-binding-like beta-propeller repeat protein, partial [Planctomycetia bacterium]|nr:PQQ-binding-like beta-propeller repeat protein [Planctomycetia bacterium]